ncbi:hypothetical protein DMC30DRAFT_418872 [Rhodotorula diobovata]|uniref:Endoplasmic reticulum protein n=1 Tax=Rhodotorula diobovata TaxID=5288 RepID=A0A5C5FQ01_9BASI|nr:hypothetical protein DMC30DRAFT_418872 [Rhodotorula diobovata]
MPKVSYPHYAWAGGHFVVLAGTLYSLLGLVTLSQRPKSYYLAYGGALVSWGIVVYKSLGVPQLNRAYVQRALLDENVQYLLLALYWFLQKPIYVTLIPFATFSLFHALTFLRTSVLPKPPAAPAKGAAAAAAAQPQSAGMKASKTIQTWVKANYEKAMLFVAFVEVVVVFGRILLGAITFQNSLLAPLFFAHFLRLRYYLSPPTRTAFGWVSAQLDHATANPKCPPAVRKGVNVAKELIIRYSESIISVQQPGGGAAPGAAGRPNAAAAEARRAR